MTSRAPACRERAGHGRARHRFFYHSTIRPTVVGDDEVTRYRCVHCRLWKLETKNVAVSAITFERKDD